MYNTGLRVSELIILLDDDIKDLDIPNKTFLKVERVENKELYPFGKQQHYI